MLFEFFFHTPILDIDDARLLSDSLSFRISYAFLKPDYRNIIPLLSPRHCLTHHYRHPLGRLENLKDIYLLLDIAETGIAPPTDNLGSMWVNGNNRITFRQKKKWHVMSGFLWVSGHSINAYGATDFESSVDELLRFHSKPPLVSYQHIILLINGDLNEKRNLSTQIPLHP
jgi:hypothetical protein